MSKVYADAKSALAGLLKDDMTIAAGGFGLCGIPENLIGALVESGVKGLTIAGNNAGVDDFGMGLLLKTRQVKKVIASYVGENKEFERQVLAGRARAAAHAAGHARREIPRRRRRHPGLLHAHRATARGSPRSKTRTSFDGREYVLEEAIRADVSIVKAWKGDKLGNLVYRKTSRNFNPMIATCGKVTVAEVEQLVEVGELDPGPDPHAGHLRRPHHPGREVREAHRVPHRLGRGRLEEGLADPRPDGAARRRRNCATATT